MPAVRTSGCHGRSVRQASLHAQPQHVNERWFPCLLCPGGGLANPPWGGPGERQARPHRLPDTLAAMPGREPVHPGEDEGDRVSHVVPGQMGLRPAPSQEVRSQVAGGKPDDGPSSQRRPTHPPRRPGGSHAALVSTPAGGTGCTPATCPLSPSERSRRTPAWAVTLSRTGC